MFKFKFNISISLTIFFFSIIGCEEKCTSLPNTTIQTHTITSAPQNTKKPSPANNQVSGAVTHHINNSPNDTTATKDIPEGAGKPLIVLLHGLGAEASYFKTLKDKLEKAYPAARVVALNAVDWLTTYTKPIEEQADLSFKELKELLKDEKHGINSPILFIGHSQGGNRAFAMAAKNKGLAIKGIVPIASPLEGVHLLNILRNLNQVPQTFLALPIVQKFLQKFLNRFLYQLDIDLYQLAAIAPILLELFPLEMYPGLADLEPNSRFIINMRNTLKEANIPIRAIGGVSTFSESNKELTKLIVDSKDGEQRHDMTVPLSSQLASNIKKGSNFKAEIIENAPHDASLLEFFPPEHQAILEHPRMFEKIQEFIDETL